MGTIEGTAADVIPGDVVSYPDEPSLSFAVARVTGFSETPNLLSLWTESGSVAILFRDDEVVIERDESADEGHECPTCLVRHPTEIAAWDCIESHDEERAGI